MSRKDYQLQLFLSTVILVHFIFILGGNRG